ncbi:MAG: ATP-binding protein [Candidatus Cyclonatronum sp.]|uniref:ATP-binding protein n=1 Tax=Cyclonatronum sp. TaxID=3024185 RepID=UPI0025C64CBF|nr:ATP-binding protein [Cyclonatronum sp.]MCH8486321.1 ATP-binding protein [Cyclonatronum sp.]
MSITLYPRTKQAKLEELIIDYPVVAIVGARQVGKTTMARQIAARRQSKPLWLDMESPRDVSKLQEAELYFANHTDKLVILDEIQHKPELFEAIRNSADKVQRNGRFLILGSISMELIRRASEILSGRISFVELHTFTLDEVGGQEAQNKLWFRGGFPRAFLARNDEIAMQWHRHFIYTYVQRFQNFQALNTDYTKLREFLLLLAQQQGTHLNQETLGRSLGVSRSTVNRYLHYLEHAYIIRLLRPWSTNVGKRMVKAPKVYVRDSGYFHSLLDIDSFDDLQLNIAVGGSWEGFVVEQTMAVMPPACKLYFSRTHHGAEADMVLVRRGKPVACADAKRSQAPKLEKGFLNVIEDNDTPQNFMIIPADEDYPVHRSVQVTGLQKWLDFVKTQI